MWGKYTYSISDVFGDGKDWQNDDVSERCYTIKWIASESSALDEAVNLFREGLKDGKVIRNNMSDV